MKPLLHKKKILITREKKQAVSFAEKVGQVGATALIADLLRITCTGESVVQELTVKDYEWLFFTSANGVECFFKNVTNMATLKHAKIAAVGTKTNEALKKVGKTADFIPSVFNAATMAKEFLANYRQTEKILLVRGSKARPELAEAFLNADREFDVMEVYRTETNSGASAKLNQVCDEETLDYMTFTSPSAVKAFHELYSGELSNQPVVVCIGSTTESAAKSYGWNDVLVPDEYTVDGMIRVMMNHSQQKGR